MAAAAGGAAAAAAAAAAGRLSREDYKKQKEIEEARKAGTLEAEKDEDGHDINPHIPQYIRDAPWYLKKDTPSLKHQRSFLPKQAASQDWYRRGEKASSAPVKFKKGACTNCGASTHKAKDCCERPRKTGAAWSGKDLQPDEVVTDLVFDYDSKRDRWNGYDSTMHATKVAEQYNKIAEERKKIKQQNPDDKKEEEEEEDESEDDEDDSEFKEDGSSSVPTKVDARTRSAFPNLRIREDTAKYLRNLDLNSAFYDPKTRSMRENPTPGVETSFVGDNALRSGGDVSQFSSVQVFAWEAGEHGQEIHVQAAPSQTELLYAQFKQRKEAQKEKQRQMLLEKYGGEEHLKQPDKRLIFAQTEQFVEYSKIDGKVIKGQERVVVRSKYEEDVYINNHTSVWGSYWENGQWGFACCKQTLKNSYCTGAAGKLAKENVLKELLSKDSATTIKQEEPEQEKKKEVKSKKEKKHRRKRSSSSSSSSSSDSSSSDSDSSSDEDRKKPDKKRGYNSMKDCTVTEEEMEEWRKKRTHREDPMANFL